MSKTDDSSAADRGSELTDRLGPLSWRYSGVPAEGSDCRCLVTLVEHNMTWVGIRAYSHGAGKWLNGGEPERARVHAWMPLPKPAPGYWSRGKLVGD